MTNKWTRVLKAEENKAEINTEEAKKWLEMSYNMLERGKRDNVSPELQQELESYINYVESLLNFSKEASVDTKSDFQEVQSSNAQLDEVKEVKAEEDLIQIGWELNFEYYHEPSGIFMSLYDISSKNAPVYNTTFNQEGYGNKEVSFEKVMEDVDKVENWFLNGGYKEFFTKIRAEEHTDNGVGGTAWVTQEQYDEASEEEGWKTSAGTFPLPDDLEYMIDSNLMISLYVYKDSIVKFEGRKVSKKVKAMETDYMSVPNMKSFLKQQGAKEISFGTFVQDVKHSENDLVKIIESHGTKKINLTYDYYKLYVYKNGAFMKEDLAKYNGNWKERYFIFNNSKSASKKHDFYIKEDFPAFDGDTRVAVIEEDENGEYFDWNYFDTYEEAEEFLKEMKGELKNKSASKKIKSFNLKDAITKIQDRYHELMDIGSWSDAEWFKKGEYAYIYIPVNKFDFRKNVTTGETDKEAAEALEELSGQKVEIVKIKATIKGPYDVMTADAKPTLVDVRFEDGQVWEDVNTEWLKHQPFGEDEDKKQIEAQIEDNRHIVERISDLLDSGFEQEEIINIVCNEFECEPQEVEQFLRKVTYASKVVSEREAGKDLNLAIRKANKVLKEEIYRWDIGRRDVAKSVAKNFEEITGVNINQLFTKVDDKYGSVIENVNAKLFDKQIPKIYKWVKNNFKIDKYDYETMQQDSDFIDMITDELVDMVDIDKVEYDKR